MNYTKYLLIVLAAASCRQLSGMEDCAQADHWSHGMCKSIRYHDMITFIEGRVYALELELAKTIKDFNGDQALLDTHRKCWHRARIRAAIYAATATKELTRENRSMANRLFSRRTLSYLPDGKLNPSFSYYPSSNAAEICKDLADAIADKNPAITIEALKSIRNDLFVNIETAAFSNELQHMIKAAEQAYGPEHPITQYLQSWR